MSHKIIKPEGIELIEYLNNGYAICNRCGAVMRQTEDPKTGCGIYICPSCGLKMDEEDYEYESDEEVEWTEEMLDMEQGDIPPAGCRACGKAKLCTANSTRSTAMSARAFMGILMRNS